MADLCPYNCEQSKTTGGGHSWSCPLYEARSGFHATFPPPQSAAEQALNDSHKKDNRIRQLETTLREIHEATGATHDYQSALNWIARKCEEALRE